MSRYSDILDEKYIEIETLRRKTVKEDYITLYNLIIQVGEHIKLEISNFNSSVYLNSDAAYSALAKLKNNYRIAEYIKDKYDYHHVDFSYPQRVKLKELTSLYNNGVFMEEEQFNIFRYNKWSTTYEAEEVNNNLTKKEIHIWLLSLFGPLLYCAILRGILFTFQQASLIEGILGFFEGLFGFFFLSAFASPILLPIEILIAYFCCKKLKDKHFDFIEEQFNITLDRGQSGAFVSAVALATKTHISLRNNMKQGSWIEK